MISLPSKLYIGDETFAVTVKTELAIGTFVPWCVEVDGAWYEVARYYDDEIEPPRSADRFLRTVQRDPTHRTPPWLANYEFPLLLSIDGHVLRVRAYHSTAKRRTIWAFEFDGTSSEGGPCHPDQTLADVEDLAKLWLRTEARSGS